MRNDENEEGHISQPWSQILLTDAIPEDAAASPYNLGDVPTGFSFKAWRSISNPRDLLRLVDKYDMLSDGGAASLLDGRDDEVWTHFGWGKMGYRAATVRITAEQLQILEGQPFWGAPLHETDPLPDDVEYRIRTNRGYIELVLQGLHGCPPSEPRLDIEPEGGAACHA